MKPNKGGITPHQSCSCTSCLYKSESDRPSLQRVIAQGSKIDKLYYGKYIPLRERKLLSKLVRTRAVYDDIRNQLLSESNISVVQADLKPKKKSSIAKPDKVAQKRGDIPALVDLVDKGNVLLSENSSECCSCCVCGSNLDIQGEFSKAHVHKHRGRGGTQMTSKSSVISKRRAGEERRMGKAVHFKTKHIRSDPCTCTYKFSETMKRYSKAMLKKLRYDRPEPVLEPLVGAPEQRKPKKKKAIRKTIERVKQSKTRLVQGMQEGARRSATKIKETNARIKENIEAAAKKSVELIQETKQRVQDKIDIRKQKLEGPIVANTEEVIEEKMFKIRKDSLTKFREKLRKKRELKDWECDFECLPQECVPEDCFRIITRKRLHKIKGTRVRESIGMEKGENKIGEISKLSDVSAQVFNKPKKTVDSTKKRTMQKTENKKKRHPDGSCLCVEIKKKSVKDTKDRFTLPDKKTSEMKSMTTPPIEPATKGVNRNLKESVSRIKFEHTKGIKQKGDKIGEAQIQQGTPSRQAVRVGSSISFNIEFYKINPNIETESKSRKEISSLIKEAQQKLKTKESPSFVKNTRKKHKGSETTLKSSGKNTQAVAHPLKRCFCTLKIKPRKTKTPLNVDRQRNKPCTCPRVSPMVVESKTVSESIQTLKMNKPVYTLEPYECKPGICIPDECDPIECLKFIRKRNNKLHSVSINTKKHMRSSSSVTTKSALSSASRGLQVQHVQKPQRQTLRESTATLSGAAIAKTLSSQRQAVRIGSTFSFEIEFSKGEKNIPSPYIDRRLLNEKNTFSTEQMEVAKLRRDRGIPTAKQYIKHKYSQMSSSTKSKFISQKHKLKRCFCTLKINRYDPKKVKIKSTSQGTVTSGQIANISKTKPTVRTVSMATNKIKRKGIVMEPQLLPYECEPGICVPGECNPYECLELIKRRETKTKTSNTDYRKTKSTSSFAPKLVKHSRAKQVQSTLVALKGKVPSSSMTKTMLPQRQVLGVPNNLNRKAVRIGSTFSINIEFYKDNPVRDKPTVYYRSHPKNINSDRKHVAQTSRRSQGKFVIQQKSVRMQAEHKKRSVPIGTAMKRCFCTLKLHPVQNNTKDVATVGTKTPKFKNKQPKFQTIVPNKNIRKFENNLQYLEPYECEPFVCTPGECDPYKCLEKIKKRNNKLYFREAGVNVEPSKVISTSSQNMESKNASAQSMAVIEQRDKKTKEKRKADRQLPTIPKLYAKNKARQSVRLGSSFSFNIEFSKDQRSDDKQIVGKPHEHGDEQDSRIYKTRGDQSLAAAMHQRKSQANVIKKSQQGTGVAPILKRCFCTRQLQNKRKHPKNTQQVYTVSRVGVTQPTFVQNLLVTTKVDPAVSFMKNKYTYVKKVNTVDAIPDYNAGLWTSKSYSYSTVRVDSKFLQPCHPNLYNSCNSIYSQPVFRVNSILKHRKLKKLPKTAKSLCTKHPLAIRRIVTSSENNVMKYWESYSSITKRPANQMSAYLKRQYCAMNIQLPVKYTSPYKQKLKPDECEPGFCVPYECDPLVCKERIMTRLMRNSSKSSGTDNRHHSSSSTTLNTPYRSRRLQSNAISEPSKRAHRDSQPKVRREKRYTGGQRQVVRLGSKFSFDIELSKDKIQPSVPTPYSSTTKDRKKPRQKLRHRGTREYLRSGTDRQSQSSVEMSHRGSSATPLLKRCFCTLKLHKKAREAMSTSENKGLAFNNDTVNVQTADSSQNTERQKYRKVKYNLDPYECEPGICVPGECNPYDCLELMKKRKLKSKDFGTDSMKFGRMSSSSMTPSQKKKIMNRQNQLNFKEKKQRVSKYKHSVQTLGSDKPSRQAVRVGSTFSFNIEFYKDNPNLLPRSSVNSRKISPEEDKKRPRQKRHLNTRFSQDNKSMRHQDSQSDFLKHIKSTMTTSSIRRCFCTAKLLKPVKTKIQAEEKTTSQVQKKAINVNIEQQPKKPASFLHKCLCAIKSLTAAKVKSGTPSQTVKGDVQKPLYQPPLQELLPYECTPGVCVPGECDPYVCEQLIKKRNAKLGTKVTSTGRPRTRSQSSSIQSYETARAKRTQMGADNSSKIARPTSSGDFDRKKQDEYSVSPGRQAVRIGSSFNFNIEFYKGKPAIETFKDDPIVDRYPKRRRVSNDSKKHKTTSRGTIKRRRHTRDSQVQDVQKQDRASGVGQMLQRCFCTLSLRKPKIPKKYTESGTQSKRTPVDKVPLNKDTKSVKSSVKKEIAYKLEPYECEPNTCIPGQCDPYECVKRIQRRLRREHGTSTVYSKTKSATSMASSTRRIKNMKVQSRTKQTQRRQKNMQETKISTYSEGNRPPSQAVRIGSSFSFDIEFYKDNGSEVGQVPKSKIGYKDVGDNSRKYKRRPTIPCDTKCQTEKRMRGVDSQVIAKKMRSTMTGVTPLLKRCFCTLKLQKPIARTERSSTNNTNQKPPRKVTTGNKSTHTSKKLYKTPAPTRTHHLEPFECEPGVCVPGQCDPLECEKRIKMRDIGRHSISSNTGKGQDSSKYVSTRTGHKDRKSQATTLASGKKRSSKSSSRPKSFIRQHDFDSNYSPQRQAVRIGSKFSLDIEFYKDNSLSAQRKEIYEPNNIRRDSDRTRPSTKTMSAGNRGISFYHRKSQVPGPKTETKGSGVGPILRRCFCTLKLQKEGKQKQQPNVRKKTDYNRQPSSFDASTETKKQKRRIVLEPYECEPNVCEPGFCNPHECLQRIKRRQQKELGISTERPSMVTEYSITSKRTTRDKALRTKRNEKPARNVTFDKEPQEKVLPSDSPNRQAVRIGSSFKFDIEFYKQSSTPNDHSHGDDQDYKYFKGPKPKFRKTSTQNSQGKCTPRCKGVQIEGAQRQSTGSGMAPLLKRCFCTLALQNTSKQTEIQKPIKQREEIKLRDSYTQSKSTFTKSKSLPYALEPYECEPDVCVPGQCDPYECYERIKRRKARYKSRGLGTDVKRFSQGSITSRYGKYSKRTQSTSFGRHRRQQRSSSMNQSMIVEQPRFPLLSDIANRNIVRIGSNISFNIEFYKEVGPALNANYDEDRRETVATIDSKRTKFSNTLKSPNYRNRESQAQSLKTENKGSLVTNALKRCFCTAQLHNTKLSQPKIDKGKMCVECKPKSIFKPQEYQVYYQKASIKKIPTKKCTCVCENNSSQTKATSTKSTRGINLRRHFTAQNKNTKHPNDMETILPYKPNKFNKKTSKTLFANKKDTVGEDHCANCKCKNALCSPKDKNSVPKNCRLKKAKSTKKLIVDKGKDNVQVDENNVSNNLKDKSFLCRCKDLFLKQKNRDKAIVPFSDNCTKANEIVKGPELENVENLKKAKSERRPSKLNKNDPKKSKSMKINKCLAKDCYYSDVDNFANFQSGDKKKKKKASKVYKSPKGSILSEDNKKNFCPHCGDFNNDMNRNLNKDSKKQVKFSVSNSSHLKSKTLGCEVSCKNKSGKNIAKKNTISINKEEETSKLIKKANQKVMKNKNKEAKECPCCQEMQFTNRETVSVKGKKKKSKAKDKNEEVKEYCHFCQEMQSSNKDSVSLKGKKKKSKIKVKNQSLIGEDNPCARGVCKTTGATFTIAPKGSHAALPGGKPDIAKHIANIAQTINAIKKAKSDVMKNIITQEQICACYSSICECAKAIRKEKEEALKMELQLKEEQRMMKEKEKRQIKEAKRRQKEILERHKRYLNEDVARRQKRLKENKYLDQRLRNVQTSDALLVADSVLDIAKLGVTVVGDVARSTCRTIIDPKYACKKLKGAAKHPASTIKDVIEDSGLMATIKRVYMRITSMKGFRTVKSKLMENQVTAYLLKMAEEDPRKRMKVIKKKKPKKPRENLDDFECSLYMGSLRKKPFLAVYHLCPWFYPHFVTLLNVVSQVTDLLLFLLAVFVWSPCILCMELCRACMCCFLCTG